jgi:hypothetical protein
LEVFWKYTALSLVARIASLPPFLLLAEFSSGSLFDVRVEVHSASNASTDHSVTITKIPGGVPQSLDSFFGVANQSSAPYTYTYVTAYNGTKATRNVSKSSDFCAHTKCLEPLCLGPLSLLATGGSKVVLTWLLFSYLYLSCCVQSVGEYWRNVSITEAGVYQVDLTANGQTTKVLWTFRPATPRVAQNTILFIADGMTVRTTRSRIWSLVPS